eukprot:gene36591-49308_t
MVAFATNGVLLMSDTVWEAKVKGLLKAELKRRNVTYAQLVEKLAAIGVVDSEPNIRNKLARAIGLASTAFCLGAYVVALNKPHEERYQPYRYAADKPRDIDPALENKANAQPLEYREPCKEPKGRDESDLCAQWRAAKAGEQSAFWAKWGFGITALGIFGLIATIIQSRIALDRAREANTIAQDTAKDARRIGAAQAAGYLHVVPGSFIEPKKPLFSIAARRRRRRAPTEETSTAC